MTAEVAFAKSFLASLDSKPVKLQSDHAADQKTIRPRGALTLPRMPHAMQPPDQVSATGDREVTSVIVKSARNPPINLEFDAQPLTMSILELKQKVAIEVNIEGTDKIRLLYNKKPCSDSKSIKDIAGEANATTEFSVMFMGVTPNQSGVKPMTKSTDPAGTPSATGAAKQKPMETDEFWTDLKGFLQQKLGSQTTAQRAVEVFRDAWNEKGNS